MEHRSENPPLDPTQVLREKLMRQKARKKAEFDERMQKARQERAIAMAAMAEEQHLEGEVSAEVKEVPIEENQAQQERLHHGSAEVKEVPIEHRPEEGARLQNEGIAPVEQAKEVPTENSGKVDELANEDSQSAPRLTGSAEITAVSQNAEPAVEEEPYVAASEMECQDGVYRSFSFEQDSVNCDGSIDDTKHDMCHEHRSAQTAADFWWNAWPWTGCCNCYSGFSERCPNFIETGCGGNCCCTEEKHVTRPKANDSLPGSKASVFFDYGAFSPLSTYSGSTSGRIREKPLSAGKKFRPGPKSACGEFRNLPRRSLKEHRRRRRRRRLRCALSGQRAWAEEARGSSSQSSLAAGSRGTLTERLLRARSCVERANNETECVPSSSPLLLPTNDPPRVAPRNRSSESLRELRHRRPALLRQQRRRPRSSLRRTHRSAILLREQGPRRSQDPCTDWLRSLLAPGRECRADHYLKSDAERRDRECLSKLEVLATPKRCSFRPDDVRTATAAVEEGDDEVQDRGQDTERTPVRAGGQDVFGRNVQRLRGGGSDVDEFSVTKQRTDARRAGVFPDAQPDRVLPSGSRWENLAKRVKHKTGSSKSVDEDYPEHRSRTLRFCDEDQEGSNERREDSDRVRGGCGRSSKYASGARCGLHAKHSRRHLQYQTCSHPPSACSEPSYPPAYPSKGGCRPPPCLPPCHPQPCCHPPPCPPPSCHRPPCPPPLCRPPPCPPSPCPPPPCSQPPCAQCQRLVSARRRDNAKGCCSCGGCGRSPCFDSCCSAPKREQSCRLICPSCKDFQSCGVCGAQPCGRIYSYPGAAGGTCCFPRNTRKRSGSECCGGGNPGCGGPC